MSHVTSHSQEAPANGRLPVAMDHGDAPPPAAAEDVAEAWATSLTAWANQTDAILPTPVTGTVALLCLPLPLDDGDHAVHDELYRGWAAATDDADHRSQYQDLDHPATAGAGSGDNPADGRDDACFYVVATLLHGTWRGEDARNDVATVAVDAVDLGPAVAALLGPRGTVFPLGDVFPVVDEGQERLLTAAASDVISVGTRVLLRTLSSTTSSRNINSLRGVYVPCQLDSVEFARDDVRRPAYCAFSSLHLPGRVHVRRWHVRLAASACAVLPWPARSLQGDAHLAAASALTHTLLSLPLSTDAAVPRALTATDALPRGAAAVTQVAASLTSRAARLGKRIAGVDPEAAAWAAVRGLRGLNVEDGVDGHPLDAALSRSLGTDDDGRVDGNDAGQTLRTATDLGLRMEDTLNAAAAVGELLTALARSFETPLPAAAAVPPYTTTLRAVAAALLALAKSVYSLPTPPVAPSAAWARTLATLLDVRAAGARLLAVARGYNRQVKRRPGEATGGAVAVAVVLVVPVPTKPLAGALETLDDALDSWQEAAVEGLGTLNDHLLSEITVRGTTTPPYGPHLTVPTHRTRSHTSHHTHHTRSHMT